MRTAAKRTVSLILAVLLLLPCFAADTAWTCPDCGKENGGNYCSHCGQKQPEPSAAAYSVGETVTLGTWGGEPIEWQVMEDRGDGSYILLSVRALDTVPYNDTETEVTWETSSVRAWLNGPFYETAFSAAEKERIVLSRVVTPDNPSSGVSGGEDTEDCVYLLSAEEVNALFPTGESESADVLLCLPTRVAAVNGASELSAEETQTAQPRYAYPLKAGTCSWWLRSPGDADAQAALVDPFGVTGSRSVSAADVCIRPVITVRLNAE